MIRVFCFFWKISFGLHEKLNAKLISFFKLRVPFDNTYRKSFFIFFVRSCSFFLVKLTTDKYYVYVNVHEMRLSFAVSYPAWTERRNGVNRWIQNGYVAFFGTLKTIDNKDPTQRCNYNFLCPGKILKLRPVIDQEWNTFSYNFIQ